MDVDSQNMPEKYPQPCFEGFFEGKKNKMLETKKKVSSLDNLCYAYKVDNKSFIIDIDNRWVTQI
ncbi:hypothetical protein OE903_16585 [Bacillus sp. B6(2022)]|nr:hypothetical protein [Bacillus sp. B6(2022)]